jgi:hypothetical protein
MLITFCHVTHFAPLVERSWVGLPVDQKAVIHHPLEGKSLFVEGDLWSISDENGWTFREKESSGVMICALANDVQTNLIRRSTPTGK